MFFAKTYYLNFSSLRSEEAIERYMNVITPDRQNRIQTTKRTETKASLLGAGLLLKAVLKKEYDLDGDLHKIVGLHDGIDQGDGHRKQEYRQDDDEGCFCLLFHAGIPPFCQITWKKMPKNWRMLPATTKMWKTECI